MLVDGTSIGPTTTDGGLGTVSYTIPISVSTGAHTITLRFAGDSLHAAGSGTGTLTVGKATRRLTLNCTRGIVRGDSACTRLEAVLPRSGGYATGKTIIFRMDGDVIGQAITDAGGRAVLWHWDSMMSFSPTRRLMRAKFAGDSVFEAASDERVLTFTF